MLDLIPGCDIVINFSSLYCACFKLYFSKIKDGL